MYRRTDSKILWGTNHRVYMYGSEIRVSPDNHVHFYNPLIPSGTDIQVWQATKNYQGNRSQPDLPLLKKGHTYRLTPDMQVTPSDSVFLKVTFLDRYDEEVGQEIEKSQEMTFTYPDDAYTYQVALLSAGVVEIEFDHLMIQEVKGEES